MGCELKEIIGKMENYYKMLKGCLNPFFKRIGEMKDELNLECKSCIYNKECDINRDRE